MSARAPLSRQPDQARVRAPFGRRLLTVADNRTFGSYRVICVSDPDGPPPLAGQFAMLASAAHWGGGTEERPYLPRAFSYARWRDGEAQFLLEDVGPGTRRLCELQEGEQLWLLGPLGRGFHAPQAARRAVLVGGGVGIAPLAIWQDVLGAQATVLLGFRDRQHAEGAALLQDVRLASDDGSVGRRGLVVDLLRIELDEDRHCTVYACGPPAMLEAVRAICSEREVPTQLALEAGMACGFGACFGCVVALRDGGYARVCVDGPVFDGEQLEQIGAPPGVTT